MELANISWEQCQEYLAHEDRVILPIGATEAHGRHLGLGCDYQLADAIARAAGERTGLLVAPVLAYGMSHHLSEFPGTISLTPATLTLVLQDLLRALYRQGVRRVLVVNGHGGNNSSLQAALMNVEAELDGLRVKHLAWWTERAVADLVERATGPQRGTHAATHETAFLMAVRPEAVHMERVAHRDAPVEPSRELESAPGFAREYPDAVMGLDPSRATPELGREIFRISVDLCVAELENW